jgi:hypothetical protein
MKPPLNNQEQLRKIKIITFHTDTVTWDCDPHPYGGYRVPHSNLIPYFLEAAKKNNPFAKTILLTDLETKTSDYGFDKVVRRPISQTQLMLERMRLQYEALATNEGDDILFLDTDILILRNISNVFNDDFDLGVTIRDNPIEAPEFTMPYNNGVVFVAGRASQAISFLWRNLISNVENMNSQLHAWSGNQFAMRDFLGDRKAGDTFTIAGIKTKVFPCSTHNYTPREEEEETHDKWILHFKGNYKWLMPIYAKALLNY